VSEPHSKGPVERGGGILERHERVQGANSGWWLNGDGLRAVPRVSPLCRLVGVIQSTGQEGGRGDVGGDAGMQRVAGEVRGRAGA
jgi:hypothetical protein